MTTVQLVQWWPHGVRPDVLGRWESVAEAAAVAQRRLATTGIASIKVVVR